MQQTIKHIARHFLSVRQQACSRAAAVCFVIISIFTISCEREPMLHLHKGGTDILVELPDIDLELQLLWDYLFSYDVEYDWQNEWLYGWDETDNELFGPSDTQSLRTSTYAAISPTTCSLVNTPLHTSTT